MGKQQTSNIQAIRDLWRFIRPYKTRFIWAIAVAGALTLVGMLPPLVMRLLVNDVAAEGKYHLLPWLIGALIGIILLRAVMTYLNARTIAFVGQRIVGRIRASLYHHVVNLPLRYHERTPVGPTMQRLTGDAAAVQNLVTGHLITLAVDLVTAIFAIAVMVKLSWLLTVLTLLLLPIFYLNYMLWTSRIQSNNIDMRSQMDHVSSMLQERLSSHDMVASYAQEEESTTHFRDRTRASRDTALRGIVYNLGFSHMTQFANAAGGTIIFVGAIYLYINEIMEYGDVIAFGAYSAMLLGPVVRFVQILQATQQAMVSIRRVDELFHEPTDIDENSKGRQVGDIAGNLRFDSFTYNDPDDQTVVLDNINLNVPAGMNLTLVGPPASGKSTLLAGVRRLIEPTQGALLVDEQDARELNPIAYRRMAPVVRESTGIFRGTIRSNLIYGEPDATDEQMFRALDIAGLGSFVKQLKNGLDTPIGAGGIRLSGGQRQRLGIARAVVANPPILILDEATAALDASSAAELLDSLSKNLPSTTMLTVARRLSVASESEYIAVLRTGKVVEAGSHAELMSIDGGVYRGLYEEQYGKQAAEGGAT